MSTLVKPRPSTAATIPGMLKLFRTEWDGIALQTTELRKQLEVTQKEIAEKLFEHEAACKVVARLTDERDQALK